jgi:hypothetical protein
MLSILNAISAGFRDIVRKNAAKRRFWAIPLSPSSIVPPGGKFGNSLGVALPSWMCFGLDPPSHT